MVMKGFTKKHKISVWNIDIFSVEFLGKAFHILHIWPKDAISQWFQNLTLHKAILTINLNEIEQYYFCIFQDYRLQLQSMHQPGEQYRAH